jgi:two-component system sensor histidine kinase TctE
MTQVRSLRGQLLRWLLIPLLCFIAFNAWYGYRDARATAKVITKHMLLASARAIAEQIRVRDGGIEAQIPPVALEIFDTRDKDHVAYRITGPDGTLLAGYPDLALPSKEPWNLQPVYSATTFRNEKMREVALRQPLPSGHPGDAALVVVAETLHSEERIANEIWLRNFLEQLFLVGVAGGLTWFGVHRGLRPLRKLRDALIGRDPQHLEPLSDAGLQAELKPLVSALNEALERVRKQTAIRRRFIADASHQIRTPLTLLKTQASIGLIEDNLSATQDAFRAMLITIDNMTRITNQLLTLARADPDQGPVGRSEVDLGETIRQAATQYAALA